MPLDTSDDLLVASFERQLRGEKRILLCNAPRDAGKLKKLTDWQIYCLAAALDVTTAVEKVWKTTYDKLPRALRDTLLFEELKNYDFQRTSRQKISDPAHWSDLMNKYLELEKTT